MRTTCCPRLWSLQQCRLPPLTVSTSSDLPRRTRGHIFLALTVHLLWAAPLDCLLRSDRRLDGILHREWRTRLLSKQDYDINELVADLMQAATVHPGDVSAISVRKGCHQLLNPRLCYRIPVPRIFSTLPTGRSRRPS